MMAVALWAGAAGAAPVKGLLPGQRLAAGRFVVKPADKAVLASLSSQQAFATSLSRATGVPFTVVRPLALGWLYLDVDTMTSEDDTEAMARRLKAIDGVAAATVDHVWRQQRVPNDPLLEFMWHTEAMNLPAAWDVTVGNAATRVGVVDTGLIAHEDLSDNTAGAIDFISDAAVANDGDGREGNGTDDCPADSGFHGTHVAGTILARGNNGVGVVGANWLAKVMAVRALGCGGGLTSDINEGALWLAGGEIPGITTLPAADRSRIINLSLGGAPGEPCDAFSAEVFAELDRVGAITIAAAGNEAAPVNSPANCGGVIAVAATGPTNQLAPYSSFGPEVDIVAPGGDQSNDTLDGILSTMDASLSDFQGGEPYGFIQGTSMATPNVAGVVSLLLTVKPTLNRSQVEGILRQTGGTCGGCQGKPFIDAGAAVAFVNSGGVVDEPDCLNTCQFADDGECDDGRAGAISAVCAAGSDCNDCDGGGGGGLPACSTANNGCQFADDNECDESDGGGACPDGSDSNDCGRCLPGGGGGGGGGGDDGGDTVCDVDNNGCNYANDGVCDEPEVCDDGSDGNDCGVCSGGNSDEAPAGFCGATAPPMLGSLWLGLLAFSRRRRRQG